MKLTELWLREWVNPPIDIYTIGQHLTMAGLEVDAIAPIDLADRQDHLIDIAITPNRGDCLSVHGIAREVAALTQTPIHHRLATDITASPVQSTLALPVEVQSPAGCAHYMGRVIEDIKQQVATPKWLQDRLNTAGIKSIHPIVDVTNYVMLELGQPMHAFDLTTITDKIVVREARANEALVLLDGSEKQLDTQTLIIADAEKPLAIAGVMGGLNSSVTLSTQSIFLESAYFSAPVIARQRQHYQLNSESAHRFERGVDPHLQSVAMERATQLICEITGGKPGPITAVLEKNDLPKQTVITLSQKKIKQVLGCDLSEETIARIFDALHFTYQQEKPLWFVKPPAYRFDLALPEDLIEELARLHGYNQLPTHAIRATLQPNSEQMSEPTQTSEERLRQAFQDQDCHEIISYSFIEPNIQHDFDPLHAPETLLNPITASMKVMRTNLWPGLIQTMLYNNHRQQERIRLFEFGVCFVDGEEKPRLGGLITGSALPLQWGVQKREADFFDLKGHLEAVLDLFKLKCDYQATQHPALHPGQSCALVLSQVQLGLMGAIHPRLINSLDLPKNASKNIFLFELDLTVLRQAMLQQDQSFHIQDPSKFPEIRRDIALLVDRTIPAKVLSDTIKAVAGDRLKKLFIFDLYQGKGMAANQKSIAIALILQHPTRTLVDEEVVALVEQVVTVLKETHGAALRS